MQTKKILLISYYWPPAASTGTQRVLKFAHHLPAYDWQPIVITVADRTEEITDESLLENIPEQAKVYYIKSWNPYRWYRIFTGKNKRESATPHLSFEKKTGWRQNISRFIRDRWFIPDARVVWTKPAISFLKKYLSENKVDAIFTSGPPHSSHLIGLAIKKQFPDLIWLADFRDPWMHIELVHGSNLSERTRLKQIKLEKEVLTYADGVISVSEKMRQNQTRQFPELPASKFHLITNGFFPLKKIDGKPNESQFVIMHSGTLYQNRSPHVFWKAIAQLLKEDSFLKNRLRIRLVGAVELEVKAAIENFGLTKITEYIGLVSWKRNQELLQEANALLVLVNDIPQSEWIITGKVFEYLATGLPILSIANEQGDLAKLIEETGSGFNCDFTDEEAMKRALLKLLEGWKPMPNAAQKYSASKKTEELVDLLNSVRPFAHFHAHP
jgi:glycosyltransferase involved in cell wall biosynthesis